MTAKRRPEDYDAMSRAVEAGEYTVRGPLELGPTLREGRRADADYEAAADSYEAEPIQADEVRGPIEVSRLTDDEYAKMAADYEEHPPTADEIAGPIDVNPTHVASRRPKNDGKADG
jgi:hypothetical protein